MRDITIDEKNYDYIDKYSIGDKNYIVFEDENGIYVNEYQLVDNKLMFINVDIELQKKILESLELDYE